MKIAIINSNYVAINKNTRKGTEIFDYVLIKNLAKQAKVRHLSITAFASGNSHLPVPIESVNYEASSTDTDIGFEHHKTYEIALISKAFSMQKEFDLYHVNLGNGDLVLPFAPFVGKPILVTMHGSFLEEKYNKKYLSLFKNIPNIYFISISNVQRQPLPKLNYAATIYHGVDSKKTWKFSPTSSDYIMWAGRAIREKGINTVVETIKKSGKKAKLFPMVKDDSPSWIKRIEQKPNNSGNISYNFNFSRNKLASQYQQAKAFLFPIEWEEPFGMVMIESMACGTPVIGYAMGSVPEVIIDGVTGFIVNPSDEDKRGNFIIKKTGVDGLNEAIQRIYALSEKDYTQMRKACRELVERKFTVKSMTNQYIEIYKKVIEDSKTSRKK
ncbi:hypothetical protein BH09PAT1_BH09PAT1_1870 [soil metagenome]